jgi:hypothetical protein
MRMNGSIWTRFVAYGVGHENLNILKIVFLIIYKGQYLEVLINNNNNNVFFKSKTFCEETN